MNFLEISGAIAIWLVGTYVICSAIVFASNIIFRKYEIGALFIGVKLALIFAVMSVVVGLIMLGRVMA
ncbi:hypothetical protein FHV99_004617 [Ochrobactrum sp. P20RRXII]|nr:hypothetical protein [Ochrobactrum sp. P20RRXII]